MRLAATRFLALSVFALLLAPSNFAGDAPAWLPISNDDLALKDNPASPGSQAMTLYREEWTDDSTGESVHSEYRRIKIFTPEGAKYANVQIPYLKGFSKVEEIRARTISPSGAITVFNGEILEKTVVKARGVNLLVKTFTLPEVQTGSIIEYFYREKLSSFRNIRWELEEELFTRRERFHFKPYTGMFQLPDGSTSSGARWLGRPLDQAKPRVENGSYELELTDVPALQSEEYEPPTQERTHWLMFIYGMRAQEDFWKTFGLKRSEALEKFVSKKNLVRQAAEQAVSPADPPETKLRKLYARAQQIRYLRSTQEERKKQHIEENENVEDVLKRGYGVGWDINVLFLALARAAGFESSLVWLAARNQYLFHKELPDSSQLRAHVVWVKAGGKEWFLDPATTMAPFGFLTWEQAGTSGVKIVPNGVEFVSTPVPQPGEAVVERRASVTLNGSGDLEGTLKVSFVGHEAIYLREEAQDKDEEHKKQQLEDLAAEWLPKLAKVKLDSAQGWQAPDQPLVASYSFTVPAFAAVTGRRLLFPVSLFELPRQSAFRYAARKFPVNLPFPFQCVDELNIQAPPGYDLESVPEDRNETASFATYALSARKDGDTLRVQRRFVLSYSYFGVDGYPIVYGFMKRTKGYDQQQAILKHAEPAKPK